MKKQPELLFQSNAPKYWDRGLSVIPVKLNTKRPAIQKWSGYNVNLPSKEKQQEWLKGHSSGGIGLCTGAKILDDLRISAIDIDDDRLVPVVTEIIGGIPCGKRGAKGLTIFVLADPEIKSAKWSPPGFKPRVELFTTTGFVVLPPSIHPDTKVSYEWIGEPLSDIKFEELPILDSDTAALIAHIACSSHTDVVLSGEGTHDAMLRLAASGLHQFCDDERLVVILSTLLPKEYSGNTLAELPEMLRSARDKGYGAGVNENKVVYDPGEKGPLPLGYLSDGRFVVRDRIANRITGFTAQTLANEAGLLGLASMDFWSTQFARYSKGGKLAGVEAKVAANAIMEACRAKGPFDVSRVHGRGVWREGDKVVVNLGEKVPEGLKDHYVCFAPLPDLGGEPPHGGDVFDVLQNFNWKHDEDAHLVLGWLKIAPVCGALEWRPHLFLTGPKNTGKTTLVRGMTGLLSPLVVSLDGQSTEAGIRQKLGPDSLPVILDEFESDGNRSRMKNVIRLARSASSAEGAVARGTPEGRVLEFNIRTTFLFAAINPIPGSAADSSRLVVTELQPHDGDKKVRSDIESGVSWMRELGSAWCQKSILDIEHVLETTTQLQRFMPPIDSRHALNMAILLSGAWVALNECVPTDNDAKTWLDANNSIIWHHSEAHEENDAISCLNYLLGSDTREATIGELIRAAITNGNNDNEYPNASLKLYAYGIRIIEERVLIANQHPGLNQVFRDSRWFDGAWGSALGRLQGAERPSNPVRFGDGSKTRAVSLSSSWFSSEDDDHELIGEF
ncbi:MAG: hypothetical protein HN673_12440 [Rhodospirillales bacterium]|jgi:hypothetical protein|nr:hypothetical protein [Rhodospirillales bacterium]